MAIVQEISLLPNKSSQSMYIRICHGKTAKVGGYPPLAQCFPYNWDATELQAFDPHSTLRCGKNGIPREGFLYQKICLFRVEPEFVALKLTQFQGNLAACPLSTQPTRLLHQVFHLTFSGFHGGSIPPPHTGKSKIHPQPFGGQIMQHHLKCRYIISIFIYIYICICITTVNPISKYSKSINPHEIQIFRL